MKFRTGKKLLLLSFCAALFLAVGCKSDTGQENEGQTTGVDQPKNLQKVTINPGFSALYERTISSKSSNETFRQTKADGYDEFIGTMTVTDKEGQNVTNSPFDVMVEINPTDWGARMDQTLSLFPGSYSVTIDVKKDNFRYRGTKTVLVRDGVDQSHDISIQPVIADTTVSVGTVTRTRKVTFKYPVDQLQRFTDPKILVQLNNSAEKSFTINKGTGETETLLNLPQGENRVKLKFFDGNNQLGKSDPDDEMVAVGNDPAETFVISMIPLEGRFNFNLAVNGGDANLSVNLPDEAITEAAGVDNLQVKASLIQSNLVKYQNETTVTGISSAYKADFQFTEVYYGNYTLRLEFIDKAKNLTLGNCETTVNIDNSSDIKSCDNIQLTRSTYATGDLLGSVHVTVKDQNLHAVKGALIKIGEQIVATTGTDSFGGSSYAHFYKKPGAYTLSAFHESGVATKEITVTALQSGLNITLKLEKQAVTQLSNRLALGWNHSCFTKEDGTVRCWGDAQHGQTGNDSNGPISIAPNEVSGVKDPIMLSAKGNTTCALTKERVVLCWGADDNGELGDDQSTLKKSIPVEVAGLRDVESIVTGSDHGCALMQDRTVQCWGYNHATNQYLGVNSSTENVFTPQKVIGLQDVKALTSGRNSTCAVLTDGTVHCWGLNSSGQLGIGNKVDQSSPQPVTALSDAIELKLGYYHGFARFADGSLKSWGRNNTYELGHNNGAVTTPQPVLDALKGVIRLTLGANHSCALLKNGTAQCWGHQAFGELGNGVYAEHSASPVVVTDDNGNTLTGIQEISAGNFHSCAWLGGDQVKCWGHNYMGAVGDGTSGQTHPNDHYRGYAVDVKGL